MNETVWIDSVPSWALGLRPSNSKFGGGIILAGIQRVDARLVAIEKMSATLGLPKERKLRSSGHVLHEVKTKIRKYAQFNSADAINFDVLKAGIKSGRFPEWVAMTAPQFGFKGAERGGMISSTPADRVMAHDLHKQAIEWSLELAQESLGAGISIWWPAWTSRRIGDPNNPPMEFQEAWDTALEFWVNLLGSTGGTMWLEWKPGDPGIDYWMTIELAIQFCNAVNAALGRIAMYINNEFAHVLLSGISVAQGVKQTIEAGLFSGFVHGNSGQKFPLIVQNLLEGGTKAEDILIGMDWDWPIGEGGKAIWDDQQEAIGLMDKAGVPVVYCEHDVNPSGVDPILVFTQSVSNRTKMLEATRATA